MSDIRFRIPRAALPLLAVFFAASAPATAKKDSGADLVAPLAGVARKVATVAPAPAWSAVVRASEADLIRFVSDDRVLVGEVKIARGIPFLPLDATAYTAPIALYDAGTGKKLWTRDRRPLPPGQYSVVAVAPAILLVGADEKTALYTALDPETGEERWKQEFRAPYSAVPSPDGEHLVVTSGGWVSRKLSALGFATGALLWERSLPREVVPKGRPPLLAATGDALIVAGNAILRISPRTGEDLWSVPSPLAGDDPVSAKAWGDGLLVSGETGIALLDAATGAVRWTARLDGGKIRAALPSDGAAIVWTRTSEDPASVRDVLCALEAESGKPLWRIEEEEIRSPLLLTAGRLRYTSETAVLCRDLATGESLFRSEVPGGFRRGGRSEGYRWLLPDLIEIRGDELVVARETFGVVKLAGDTGKILFSHEIERDATAPYAFDSRASDLFGAYWSGQMKDLAAAEERFRGVMAHLLDGAVTAAQASAGTSVLLARARPSAPAAGSSATATGPTFAEKQARRDVAAYDRAISQEISRGTTPADPAYRALDSGRDLARETVRQESRARVASLGAEASQQSVLASMESMMATIELCNAVMTALDDLSTAIREAEGLRKFVDLRHAVEVHRSSLQERFYIRPFRRREARGMVVVDLATGRRADFLFSVQDDFFLREIGVDLPRAVEAPDGERIVTKGIALDPAAYETYKIGLFRLPHPSLIAFDAETIFRIPAVAEFDLVEASAHGDVASVRALLTAGVSPDSRDDQGNGAMVRAAKGGHAEVVRALLDAGGRLDLPDGKSNLPFGQAILDGQAGVVDVLLEAGADVNGFDAHGQAPLCWAVVAGRPDVVRTLLSKGANARSMHTAHPPDVILKDANLIRGLCADDACRARFDEAIALIRGALGE